MGIVRKSSYLNNVNNKFKCVEDLLQVSRSDALELRVAATPYEQTILDHGCSSEASINLFADFPPPLVEISSHNPGISTPASGPFLSSCFQSCSEMEDSSTSLFNPHSDFAYPQVIQAEEDQLRHSRSWHEASEFLHRLNHHDNELQSLIHPPIAASFDPPVPASLSGSSYEQPKFTLNDYAFAPELALPFQLQAGYVQQLDDNYLNLMEYPPVHVNYLTDINRSLLLGSHALNQEEARFAGHHPIAYPLKRPKEPVAPNAKELKRNASTLNDSMVEERPLKRASIENLTKQDEPAPKRSNSSSSSSCTTIEAKKDPSHSALNTNLKPRARQGTANDPQSIAARQRRERISERLKILQNLVPNGSKVDLVTMLEKAINYVKFMQLQVQVLTTDEYWPKQSSSNDKQLNEKLGGDVVEVDEASAS